MNHRTAINEVAQFLESQRQENLAAAAPLEQKSDAFLKKMIHEARMQQHSLIRGSVAEIENTRKIESATLLLETRLEELSKGTLGAYVKKASGDLKQTSMDTGKAITAVAHGGDAKHVFSNYKKADKRLGGIGSAVKRLVKEALDKLDEGTLKKYKVTVEHGPHESTAVVVDAKDEKQARKAAVKELLKQQPAMARQNPYASQARLIESEDLDEAAKFGGLAPKGHTIEAHGTRGMKNTLWRKTFKHSDHLNKWAEENDSVEVIGTRDLEQAKKGNLSPAVRESEELDEGMDVFQVTHNGHDNVEKYKIFPKGKTVINHTTRYPASAKSTAEYLKKLGFLDVKVKKNGVVQESGELDEGIPGKRPKKANRFHITNKDGRPATLGSYPDRASAEKDRDEKFAGANVEQRGPRGKLIESEKLTKE
jgi:hypothetical protein